MPRSHAYSRPTWPPLSSSRSVVRFLSFLFCFFFSSRRRHTRSVSAFLLNRSSDLRSAHKFEQICRHRLRRQNVGYSNFSQPQSHLSFCVLLQYLVERRRVVTQLGKLD